METSEKRAGSGLAERVIGLGREGLGRAEIAGALDVSLAGLEEMEGGDAGLAAALRRAADLELAWWEGLPREALAAGARLDAGAWREAMRWRFGAARWAAADAAGAPAAAAEPAAPRKVFYRPENFSLRRLDDGTPITPQMRREMAIAKVRPFLERAEARLAEAEAELASWRRELRCVEARNYDPDAEDVWDDDEDPDEELEDAFDDDEGDDDDDDRADGDAHDGRDEAADGGPHDERAGDGGDGGGLAPPPSGSAGHLPRRLRDGGGADGGAGEPVSGVCAGREWPLPAGGAGPPAWAAQPHFREGDAADPQGVRPGLR